MKFPKESSAISLVKKCIIILFSNIIIAFSVGCFLVPNKIVNGGVTGIANIIFHSMKVPVSITMIIVNLSFALISFKKLGLKFLVSSFINTVIISIFSDIFMTYLPPLTQNTMLAAIFGGILYGAGIAFCFAVGVSTGGTDIISRFLQCINPHIKIGKILLGVDAAIILVSLIIFKQIDLALFGIITLFLSTYSVDWFIGMLNVSKLAFVVTEKGEEMSKFLTSTSPRGVTVIDVKGAYSGDRKSLLLCALKSNEIVAFQQKILEIDKTAFIIFSESQQIVGNGFRVYR